MPGGRVRDMGVGLGLWACIAAGLAAGLAAGCARDSQALPVRSPAASPPASEPTPTSPPAKPRPKRDVNNPDACQQARSDLKQLEQQAAVGCTSDDQCLLDADCLIRTTAADTTEIQEARMAMESVCARQAVERVSCTEGPARCASGRCVAPPASP